MVAPPRDLFERQLGVAGDGQDDVELFPRLRILLSRPRRDGGEQQRQDTQRSTHQAVTFALLARLRSCGSRYRLRNRIFFGVTSTISSSSMYAMACSSVMRLGGVRRMASSLPPLARKLVSCLAFIGFTSRSSVLAFSPMIMPSYSASPCPTNRTPRSSSGPSA